MAITKVTNRVLDVNSVGVAQLSAGAVPTKLGSEIGPLAFRNKIINGNFDIWQRGTSIASNHLGNNIYSADRWIIRGEGSTGTVTRQEFTLGQTDVPNNPTYYSRIVVTSVVGVSNSLQLRQRIEDIRTLAGKTATLTFWAKSNVSKTIGVYFNHEVGSGGTGDAVGIGPGVFNLTATWQKITHTVTIPSIAGKTIGEGNFLGLDIFLDAGSNFNTYFSPSVGQKSATVDIAQVQLEEGPVATPFEQRPIGTELAMCQRYYEKSYPIDVAPGAVNDYRGSVYEIQAVYATNSFSGALLKVTFKETKRISAPTVTIYNPNNGTANQLSIWSGGSSSPLNFFGNVAISTPVFDHTRGLIWPITGTTVNSGYICIAHWVVDAEL
jgi:hypothetical protein